MEKSEMFDLFVKKYGISGMQETRGQTGILRALMRVSETIESLENERQTARSNAFKLNQKSSQNSGFHRTLSLAEARCSLLEEQLQSLRQFLRSSLMNGLEIGINPKTSDSVDLYTMNPELNTDNQSHNSGDHRVNLSTPFSLDSERVLPSAQRRVRHHLQTNDTASNASRSASRSTTLSHYHIKMSNMPFVSTASTAASYSLRANIQNLHSLVTSHNPNIRQSHRRGRSSSADRQRSVRSKQSDGHSSLPRWHSLSDVSKSRKYYSGSNERRRSRMDSLMPSDLMADLDTVPVRLEKHPHQNRNVEDKCECPGKVCIKTELHCQPKGCSKTFEVKMTTSSCGMPTRFRGKANLDSLQNKRQLLHNLKDLQDALRRDQLLLSNW